MMKRLAFAKRLWDDPQIRADVVKALRIVSRHAASAGRDLADHWRTIAKRRQEDSQPPHAHSGEVLPRQHTTP